MKRIHFIAIGGAAMHNLAIALHNKGFLVTGSDDEINEPSRSRLKSYGLLPANEGWDPSVLMPGMDVILGMHARTDNPELKRAQELGLRIYSYPEYIFEQSRNKKRVVIGGSHGKTTITAMTLHVLRGMKMDFDYMVGAQLTGFDTMVRLTEEAPVIILEGDEYLSSPIDRRPKFHLYHAEIGLISGIAWDHINVFPTFDQYTEQFRIFARNIPEGGSLIYCKEDQEILKIILGEDIKAHKTGYGLPDHFIKEGNTFIRDGNEVYPLQVFGEHNLMNIEAARLICRELRISSHDFYTHISTFTGAARRLELIAKNKDTAIYKDFAHSPSKLKATTKAVKNQFPERVLIACMELHTFSSLNENFLDQYQGSMETADEAIVYYNPHTIDHKKLKPIESSQVVKAFGRDDIKVFTDSAELRSYLVQKSWPNKNLLLMSSGTFDGMDFLSLSDQVLNK